MQMFLKGAFFINHEAFLLHLILSFTSALPMGFPTWNSGIQISPGDHSAECRSRHLPKCLGQKSIFCPNSGAPMWEALSWVPFWKVWEVTRSGAFQSLGQVPPRHLRKWLDRHLIKYYTWLQIDYQLIVWWFITLLWEIRGSTKHSQKEMSH